MMAAIASRVPLEPVDVSIPNQFIWPESLRPSSSTSRNSENDPLPIIDLAELEGGNRRQIVEEFGRACRDWGFFQVFNHGIASSLAKRVLDVAMEFFLLPSEEKSKYSSSAYLPNASITFGKSFNPSVETVQSWREFVRQRAYPLEDCIHFWPDKPDSYRTVLSEYAREIRTVSLRILAAVSEGLGVAPDFIEKAFGDPSQILVLNYYPVCENPDLTFGIPPHSDLGGLTVILPDDVPGLQIKHQGKWIDVPVRDALNVFVGDQIQILTNGQCKSVEHRVLVNASATRISIPSLIGPSLDMVNSPAMEFVDENNPILYKPTVYSEYMVMLQRMGLHGKALLESRKV